MKMTVAFNGYLVEETRKIVNVIQLDKHESSKQRVKNKSIKKLISRCP